MQVVTTIPDVRRARAAAAGSWGLVPTMGYLHAGHLSLVAQARRENDHVAVSIFVNPTQFGPGEDLASYPRDLARDLALLEAARVDLVWTPTVEDLYPPGYQTYVVVEEVTKRLEGAARPTHFRGVATVVAKLFNVIQPDRAYFGQKDAQQVVVIRRMTRDLDFPVDIVVGPTLREPDGLAMSSRNVYLTPEQRRAAPALYRALSAASGGLGCRREGWTSSSRSHKVYPRRRTRSQRRIHQRGRPRYAGGDRWCGGSRPPLAGRSLREGAPD